MQIEKLFVFITLSSIAIARFLGESLVYLVVNACAHQQVSMLVQAEDIATTLYPYIYTNLYNWPCVRLLNATGTIGCHCNYINSCNYASIH